MENLYKISRKVVFGRSRGKKLGFPTANLKYYKYDNVLKGGVYYVVVKFDAATFHGLAHVGKTVTFEGKNDKIEIYLLGCSKSLYGKILNVNFIKRIRETRKFKNKKLLIKQIERDCRAINKFIENKNNVYRNN